VAHPTNLIDAIAQGKTKELAKAITIVENELDGHYDLLMQLTPNLNTKVIGLTGPPGAGKSTLVNALLKHWTDQNKRVAVLSVDPSSPFNYGALLGDRIRMNDFYLNENVFIRSMASRGSLGGLNAKIIEITDVVRSANFDYIIIETVGVGQSEVEIAGIADTTIVTVVPEAGDEVQTMKSGVMEIADIFVVNKSDRPNASEFVKNLKTLAHSKATDWETPVVKSVATTGEGINELGEIINKHHSFIEKSSDKKIILLTEKAYQLIQQKRMQDVSKIDLFEELKIQISKPEFNLYYWIKKMS
jgi:LAO/AO transport system kinase